MTIPGPEVPPQSQSLEQPETLPSIAEGSELEQKTGNIAKTLSQGVLPERFPPLSTRKAVLLNCSWLRDVPSVVVEGKMHSILHQKGISGGPAIGAEAVAVQRMFKNLQRLVKSGGHELGLPQFEEYSPYIAEFPKVKILFSEKGATVVGIDKGQLHALLQVLEQRDPPVYERLSKVQQEGKLAAVSRGDADQIKQMADDRFSEVATELQQSVQGGGQTSEETEEAEIGSQSLGSPITVRTVEAAEANEVAKTILLHIVASAQQRLERSRQQRKEEARREQEEIHRDELKKNESTKRILSEEIRHFAEKKEAVAQEKGEQASYLRIHTYEERKKHGLPTPPPGSQQSE